MCSITVVTGLLGVNIGVSPELSNTFETLVIVLSMSVHRHVEFHGHRRADGQVGKRKADLRVVYRIGNSVYFYTAVYKRRSRRDRVGKYEIAL